MWELVVHKQVIAQKWDEITQGEKKMHGREILTFHFHTTKERSSLYILHKSIVLCYGEV